MKMEAHDFLAFAEQEARRYGNDPFVFVRELVQNSRDAGASQINFQSEMIGQTYVLRCADDGCGMNAEQLQGFLLKLFASNKQDNQLGMFGVGFWSVLLFEPEAIYIDTCTGSERHVLSYQKGWSQAKCKPMEPGPAGTQIILHKQAPNGDQWSPDLFKRLVYYCGYVVRLGGENPKNPMPLPIRFNGQAINQSMQLNGLTWQAWRGKRAWGVIGLGANPLVRLYKAGILIKECTSLNELWPSRPAILPKVEGFYPQVLINCADFNLLLDRHTIAEDHALAQVLDACSHLLKKQAKNLLNQMAPMDLVNGTRYLLMRQGKKLLFALVALLVVGWSGWFLTQQKGPVPISNRGAEPQATQDISAVLDRYRGPIVDNPNSHPPRWQVSLEGPRKVDLILGLVDQFDRDRGWLPRRPESVGPYPPIANPADGILRIRLQDTRLPMILPYPLLGAIKANTVQLDGKPFGQVGQTRAGEPMLLGSGVIQGELSYAFVLDYPNLQMQPPLSPPRLAWDAEFKAWLDQAPLSSSEANAYWVPLLQKRFGPPQEVQPRGTTWLERALSVQNSDCDMVNGLLTLLFLEQGFQARLALGLVISQGPQTNHLHAWTLIQTEQGFVATDASHPNFSPLVPPDPADSLAAPAAGGNMERQLAPSQASPIVATQAQTPFPWRWIWLGLIALLILLLLRYAWKVKRAQNSVRTEQLAFAGRWLAMVVRSGDMHHDLFYRPLFSRADGKRVSFYTVLKWAENAPLLMGTQVDHGSILDKNCPILRQLLPYLPEVLDRSMGFSTPGPAETVEVRPGTALLWGPTSDGWLLIADDDPKNPQTPV
ncbi:MAG: ATP-binding protein [Acidobacteria bacterium]|nr:ATP-binding protein [Acidobacteriota bacterium]MCB9397276.1 ATP-binding protein [Acidobacteriota bacterium]